MLTLLPDLNVAPLKYAHVHREHGGPIFALSFVEREQAEGTFFEAHATLETKCVGDAPGPHGTGYAASKADAIHSAVSDAMAFWAYHTASRTEALRTALRFDLDNSRLGFAAFPGLGVQGAHKRALFSAAERWTLCAWWEGVLAHTPLEAPGVSALQIRAPIPGVSTVIAWEPFLDLHCFGIGTSATPSLAHAAARLSLYRNRARVAGETKTRFDHRLRHFAGPGFEMFSARAARPGARVPPAAPCPALESAVAGPWHQYAHVWRCLFDCSAFREKDTEHYFVF
jgi:hypothetical protein